MYDSPVFHVSGRQKELLDMWWSQVEWIEGVENTSSREEMLRNSIRNLFIATDTEITHVLSDNRRSSERSRAWTLVNRFFHLVATRCQERRDVGYYADLLALTTTYLYKLCRKLARLSPKEIIEKQVITEIKTYLVNTDLSIKGIATEIHFEDVSYMCRYFRRVMGISPIDFRKGLGKV